MAKKKYKDLLSKNSILNHKKLLPIKNRIKNPKIWKINERNTKKAFAIGIFSALLPIPCQMLLSAYLAVLFEANITFAVILVWITNPLTMPIVFYVQYKTGSYFIQNNISSSIITSWDTSWYWYIIPSMSIIKPFLLGVIITSTLGCLLAYILCSIFWKMYFFIKN